MYRIVMQEVWPVLAAILTILTLIGIALLGWYLNSVSHRQDEIRSDVRELRQVIDNSARDLREAVEASRSENRTNAQNLDNFVRGQIKDVSTKLETTGIKLAEISTLASVTSESRVDRDKLLNNVIERITRVETTTENILNGMSMIRRTLPDPRPSAEDSRTPSTTRARSD